MDEDLHNIEDLFREGLEANEEMPYPKVWNDIDNVLDRNNLFIIKEKYTSLKRVTLFLLFLLAGLLIYEFSNRHNNQGKATGNNLPNTQKINNDTNEKELAHTNESQNSIDSKILKNKSDGNSAFDNRVIDKITPHNSLQIQPGNNGIKENNPSSNNNTIRGNTLASKITEKITNTYLFKDKGDSLNPMRDNQQIVVNNDTIGTNQQFQLLSELNSVNFDKLSGQMEDSVGREKSAEPGKINEIIPSNTIKINTSSNTKKQAKKPSNIFMTPFFSPDIAWYRLQQDKPDNQSDTLAEIERSEKHEFSSTLGILVDYMITKHWSLQSGLTYSNTHITVDPKTIYAQNDNSGNVKYRINTSSGYGYVLPSFSNNPNIGDSLYAFSSTHILRYIGIPATLKYNISSGKFSFYASAGLSANFLIKGKIETTVENGFDNETEVVNNIEGLKKVYLGGITSLGVEYKLSKKIALSFVPTFRFALNPINRGASVTSYPHSFGLAVGLKTRL